MDLEGLELRLGRSLDAAETARALALLDDTIAQVLAYIGHPEYADEMPVDVASVIYQITGRALGRAADETGLTQESIGSYSYSVGAAAAAGTAGMLPDERAVLDRHRQVVGVIRMDADLL